MTPQYRPSSLTTGVLTQTKRAFQPSGRGADPTRTHGWHLRDIAAPISGAHAYEERSMTKQEWIRSRLREEILQGRYSPGDPIPERAVAEELAVSRIPVREALIQLERDGLVSITPRRGAQVRSFSLENIQSLYEAREALEGEAARLAAHRLDPMALVSFTERYQALLSDPRTMSSAETSALGYDFHDAIIRGSRNSVIIEMSVAIADRVELCRRYSYGRATPQWSRRAAEEHIMIAQAIGQSDPELAERRMREHIRAWADFLRTHMAGDGPDPNARRT